MASFWPARLWLRRRDRRARDGEPVRVPATAQALTPENVPGGSLVCADGQLAGNSTMGQARTALAGEMVAPHLSGLRKYDDYFLVRRAGRCCESLAKRGGTEEGSAGSRARAPSWTARANARFRAIRRTGAAGEQTKKMPRETTAAGGPVRSRRFRQDWPPQKGRVSHRYELWQANCSRLAVAAPLSGQSRPCCQGRRRRRAQLVPIGASAGSLEMGDPAPVWSARADCLVRNGRGLQEDRFARAARCESHHSNFGVMFDAQVGATRNVAARDRLGATEVIFKRADDFRASLRQPFSQTHVATPVISGRLRKLQIRVGREPACA